jgi:hypothetical protein
MFKCGLGIAPLRGKIGDKTLVTRNPEELTILWITLGMARVTPYCKSCFCNFRRGKSAIATLELVARAASRMLWQNALPRPFDRARHGRNALLLQPIIDGKKTAAGAEQGLAPPLGKEAPNGVWQPARGSRDTQKRGGPFGPPL